MPFVTHNKEVNPDLSRLSYEQRQLRQLIYNDHRQDVTGLHLRRNWLLHQIRERSKALARAFIDDKLAIIEQTSHSTQMFEATRALFKRRPPVTSLRDPTKANTFSATKKQVLSNTSKNSSQTPCAFYIADDGLKRPLDNLITAYELECAFRRLRNGRATALGDTKNASISLESTSHVLLTPSTVTNSFPCSRHF